MVSRAQDTLLAVEHERDLPRPDLDVLGAVIVHVLATGNEAARLDGEVHDRAAGFVPRRSTGAGTRA